MKSKLPKLVLPFGMLLALGCGERTSLDSLVDETTSSTGGGNLGTGGHGGTPGSGGQPSPGGAPGGTGGSTGGTRGYYVTGGAGGYYVGGGGRIGSVGGSIGGQAGFGPGGSPLSGGTPSVGGMMRTGGMMNTGGIMNSGGRTGGAAGSIAFDGGPGGKGGAISPDAAVDNRLADGKTPEAGGPIRTDGPVEASGSTCTGLGSNEELIDDLNDGNRFIPSFDGRVGSWADSDDATPGGTMYPNPANSFTPTDTGDVCRKYAAYVKGTGFSDSGASFWFGLGSPYNASKYTGVSFWAKVDSGTTTVLHVTFPDKDTYPDGGICKTNSNGSKACYDHYGSRITLTTDWKKYAISFSQISQDGWGLQGTQFDSASLYQVLFQIPVNATFGIWIDDIAFTM